MMKYISLWLFINVTVGIPKAELEESIFETKIQQTSFDRLISNMVKLYR
jgi:hypothetical protein